MMMMYLTIDGDTYACPFENAVRPHTPAEWAALEADILRIGEITVRVLTYYSPRWGRAIIDGMSRTQIGLKHGIEVPIEHIEYTDAEAEDRAKALNYARRHLTPEEQAAERARRIPRVVERAQKGESLRQIAAAEDISPTQVRLDLEAAQAQERENPENQSRPSPSRKKKPVQVRAVSTARSLSRYVKRLLADTAKRTRLRALALDYGVPLSDDGRSWPALDGINAAIRDMQ